MDSVALYGSTTVSDTYVNGGGDGGDRSERRDEREARRSSGNIWLIDTTSESFFCGVSTLD